MKIRLQQNSLLNISQAFPFYCWNFLLIPLFITFYDFRENGIKNAVLFKFMFFDFFMWRKNIFQVFYSPTRVFDFFCLRLLHWLASGSLEISIFYYIVWRSLMTFKMMGFHYILLSEVGVLKCLRRVFNVEDFSFPKKDFNNLGVKKRQPRMKL